MANSLTLPLPLDLPMPMPIAKPSHAKPSQAKPSQTKPCKPVGRVSNSVKVEGDAFTTVALDRVSACFPFAVIALQLWLKQGQRLQAFGSVATVDKKCFDLT